MLLDDINIETVEIDGVTHYRYKDSPVFQHIGRLRAWLVRNKVAE